MENTQENAPENKKDPSKVVLVLIILVLLGAIGYLVFNNQSKQQQIIKVSQENQEQKFKYEHKIKELEELQHHYEKLKEEKELLGLKADSLDEKIQEIELLKKQLREEKISIHHLNEKLTRYQGDFIKIKDNYDSLLMSNRNLGRQRDSLYAVTKTIDDSLTNLAKLKNELAKQVAIASQLKAENIKISVINGKGKELISDHYKVKMVDKIKISFNLADNKVAKKNSKEVYFRLIEPSGSTLFAGDKVFALEGKESFYTDKQSIQFDNSLQQITFFYQKGSPYKPGKYIIELFAEGYKIGESEIVLK